MKADDIIKRMEELNRFILDADDATRDGRIVDLSRLEKDAGLLSDKALALPHAEARNVQPAMAEMIGNLERLMRSIQELKDRLKERR